jgi:glyoxylase-like metal-dependent hydrolase (beta-lactamase superfamily II)
MTQLDTMTSRRKITIHHLAAPDVYRIPTGMSNAYLVETSDGSYVLVDAGPKGYACKILQAASKIFGTDRPHAIILTHGHRDHAGGLPQILQSWPDIPVYAHPMELPYLNEGVRYPPGDPTVGGFMAEMSRFIDSSQSTTLSTPALPLSEETGPLPFMPGWELRPTPGHTPGHISLWNPSDRTLLAGDAISTIKPDNPLAMLSGRPAISVPPPFATYNWHHARQSARALAELEPEYLCCGHGKPLHGRHVARDFHHFAANFPTPRRGRYAHTHARFNREGPTFIPPPPADLVKQIVITGTMLALGAAIYSQLRPRNNRG